MFAALDLPTLARQCARDLRNVSPRRMWAVREAARRWWVDTLVATRMATAPDTSRPIVEQWRELERLSIAELIDWCDRTATEGEPCTPQ